MCVRGLGTGFYVGVFGTDVLESTTFVSSGAYAGVAVPPMEEASIVNEAGSGVSGLVDGVTVAVGNREWVLRHSPGEVLSDEEPVRPNGRVCWVLPGVSH